MQTSDVDELYKLNQTCSSGASDITQYLKYFFQLCYILPFVIIYISFVVTIFQRKKNRDIFSDSFFKIYIVDGVVSVLFVTLDFSFIRSVSYIRPICELFLPSLKWPDYYLTPYNFIYFYCHFSKMITTTTMSINRFTSVNYPLSHRKIWKDQIYKIIIFLIIAPFFFTWPIAATKTYLFIAKGQAQVLYVHLFPWARTTYFKIAIGVPALIFIIYSNVKTMTKLSKLGNNMKNVEVTMCIATIFVSSGFVVFLILQVCFVVLSYQYLSDSPIATSIILALQQLSNDFFMLSGPIVLLILNKRIRYSIFRVKSKRRIKTQAVTSHPLTVTGVFSTQPEVVHFNGK